MALPITGQQELPDEVKRALKSIVDHFDDEDRAVRDRQIRTWRKLKLLWENIQQTYYSEVAHDWRIPEVERAGEANDQAYYDKPVNVYRAYLESIIAALSVVVPPIACYPDDADNPLDVMTAKAGDKIAALIFRHNEAPLLWLHALFILCTEGMVGCYGYSKEDKKFGTYKVNQYQDVTEQQQQMICPNCGTDMIDPNATADQQDKFQPGPQDAPVNNAIDQGLEVCPNCAQQVIPDLRNQSVVVTKIVGTTQQPKSRICLEVFGGLFIKVPVWARTQEEALYLIYSYETHYANVLEQYPDLKDKITSGTSNYDLYEQWGRTSPQYRGEHPINNVTVRKCWLRPATFNLANETDEEELRRLYPNGVQVVIVNDQVAAANNESLDDCWTLTYNPLSDYLHFDPIGLLLTSIQDITNDLISLTLQTIEHGIPQTFADPKTLNFNAYRNSEVIPGGIYPAAAKSGRPLSEGFHEVKTATLSQEVLPFAQKIQELGQLVSGALPSLFGGQMSGSRTASEYSMSKNQALQRLQTDWKMLTGWWKQVFGKAIPLYIKTMRDDEKQVKRDEFGNFVNIYIRKSELEGKLGSIELEANENLPITLNQQKDVIMELFQLNNDEILQTLASPQNLPYIKKALGLTEYVIPGEDERQKEYEEIQLLVSSEPIQMPPDPMAVQQAMAMGMPPPQPQMMPSVEPDFDLDNHEVAADIDRTWLIGDAGRLCKTDNPSGYQNVLLHMKMHKDMSAQQQQQQLMAQMQQQQIMQPPQGRPSPRKPPQRGAGVPLQGDQNAPTVQ